MSDTAAVPAVFTPSELVVLFGDRFAPEAGMLASKEEVMTSGAKVHAQKLMEAAVAAAVLAVHGSGAARLEERTGTRLFGLMKKRMLHLVRGSAPSPFPGESLEGMLVAWSDGAPEVWEALTRWIGKDSMDPSKRMLGLIKAGLAARGLLEVEARKALRVFTVSSFSLPDATRAAAAGAPLDPVHGLLREAEQREPALWQAVRRAVDAARIRMTESSSD